MYLYLDLLALKVKAFYAGLLVAPVEDFGIQPRRFFALQAPQKKFFFRLLLPFPGHFCRKPCNIELSRVSVSQSRGGPLSVTQ